MQHPRARYGAIVVGTRAITMDTEYGWNEAGGTVCNLSLLSPPKPWPVSSIGTSQPQVST